MENIETVASFALSRIFRYEPRLAKAIVETLGSAEAIFRLDKDGLFEALGPFNKYREPIAGTSLDKASQELDDILKDGYSYIPHCHPDFPRNLSFCEDAPVGFFLRSDDSPANIFSGDRISIVGTRDITPYGREWCRRLTSALGETEEKPTIVSGLAYGVDINAQVGALDNGLKTISVLGNGIGSIYPANHASYADRICHTSGCGIITEYPPGADVTATNFLCRNRIIAGLSDAVVLIESAAKGGSLITAEIAGSYNRECFAFPGSVGDPYSVGCNELIRDNKAALICSAMDFVNAMNWSTCRSVTADEGIQTSLFDDLTADERRVLERIRQKAQGAHLNVLITDCNIPYARIMPILFELEMKGLIRMCPGSMYKPA